MKYLCTITFANGATYTLHRDDDQFALTFNGKVVDRIEDGYLGDLLLDLFNSERVDK